MSALERAAELSASLVDTDWNLQALPFIPLMVARLRKSNARGEAQDSEPNHSFWGTRKFIEKPSFHVELDVVEIALGGPCHGSRQYPFFYGVCWSTVSTSEGWQE